MFFAVSAGYVFSLLRKLYGSEAVMGTFTPSYIRLHQTGELRRRGKSLWNMMASCTICPRECRVNRLDGETGLCGASSKVRVASFHPHFGEEEPLVGQYGSGTIFFTHCTLRCVFCINWEISQGGQGYDYSVEDLADMMLKLQQLGCHNINVVTPTHYVPHIVLALDIAAGRGLRVPLVYNTCGWERLDILRQLDGIVDIYLPDFKYFSGEMAQRFSSATSSYPQTAQQALIEMNRQAGVARPDDTGLINRGLMIRHLVMPNNVGGSKDVVRWIADNLPNDTYVNIMSQYRPMFKAFDYPLIARPLNRTEYKEVIDAAREAGLTRIEIQGMP